MLAATVNSGSRGRMCSVCRQAKLWGRSLSAALRLPSLPLLLLLLLLPNEQQDKARQKCQITATPGEGQRGQQYRAMSQPSSA